MGLKAWGTTNNTVWTTSNGTIVTSLVDADNPQGLRPYTIRFQFDDGSYDPTNESWSSESFWVQVSSSPNVWDFTKVSSNWGAIFSGRFQDRNNIVHVVGANLLGVATVGSAFVNCTALRSVGTMDISTATNLTTMFSDCSALNSITSLNTASATEMRNMFSGCTSLSAVPSLDTSHVTTMSYMFSGCRSITSVPLFNTSNVTSMASMFEGCVSLTSVPLFDTSKVTMMSSMFSTCLSLATAPLFDTSKVTTMATMFQGCSSLTTVPLYNTVNVANVTSMFSSCKNVESGALALYQQMSSQVLVPEIHPQCFTQCGSLTASGQAELAQIPVSWGGTMA